MPSYDFEAIVKEIDRTGYYELTGFFTPAEHKLIAQQVTAISPGEQITRQQDHPLYRLVTSKRISDFFMSLAKARLKYVEKLPGDVTIPLNQFAIGVAKKGPDHGNAAMHRLAFHYDDSYLNAVYALEMPKDAGAGLMIYNNIRRALGYGLPSKVLSRVVGRIPLVRKVYKPGYVRYRPGGLYIFFGDVTLHGVGSCFDGNRISFTINLSRVPYQTFLKKKGLAMAAE